ncbi:sigma factor-like helix-turn-helix DNA-binding protein [Macrococcus epidermidis]
MLRAHGMSYSQIGKKIGYSHERIRQLYENALNKICG